MIQVQNFHKAFKICTNKCIRFTVNNKVIFIQRKYYYYTSVLLYEAVSFH